MVCLAYQCISVQLEAIRAHYVVFGLERNTLFDPKCTIELERNLLTLLLIFDIPMIGILTFYIDFQRAMNIHIL